MAVIRVDDLDSGAGHGWIDDVAEPVSAARIAQLECDSGRQPIVLGSGGEVLFLGRSSRDFDRHQRKAMAVRDGGCIWPGCSAPPGWCDAHHVVRWSDGGLSDIDNGVLLCSAHHHLLHNSAFVLRMVSGRPRLLSPPWLDPQQAWQPLGKSRVLMRA